MINLLPPELKESYRYAHRNVALVRWVAAFAIGFIGLLAISTAGAIYVHQTAQSYTKQVADQEAALRSQDLEGTQRQVKDMTDSLKLAVQVLSKEVLFSKLLTQLATVTPSNVVLTDLSISESQTAVNISALTTDYAAATQLQINLADPANKIFTSADIVSINCGTNSAAPHYPCTVTLNALFTSNNPFLFINDGGKS